MKCREPNETQAAKRSSNREAAWRTPKGGSVSKDINVVALVKGEERYIFLFDDENRGEALRTLGRYASNSELSFSWYDAAVLSQKIRKTRKTEASVCGPVQGRFELPPMEDLFSGEEPMV